MQKGGGGVQIACKNAYLLNGRLVLVIKQALLSLRSKVCIECSWLIHNAITMVFSF